MAQDKPISQLSQADLIDGTEMIPFAKNGANGKMPSALLKDIPIIDHTDIVATIQPNVLNRWGEAASLTINFAESDTKKVAEYMVEFISGEVPTTLSLPEEVKFPYDVEIEANMKYQLSVVDNVGLIVGVEL